MSAEIESLQSQLGILTKANEELRMASNQYKEELADKDIRIQELQIKLEDQSKTTSFINNQFTRLQDENSSLKELAIERDHETKKLQQEITSLVDTNKILTQNLANCNNNEREVIKYNEDAKVVIAELHKNEELLKSQIQQLSKEIDKRELKSLIYHKEMEEERRLEVELQAELSRIKHENSELSKRQNTTERDLEEKKKEVEDMEQSLHSQLQTFQLEKEELHASFSQKYEEIGNRMQLEKENLIRDVGELAAKVEEQKKEIELLHRGKSELEKQLQLGIEEKAAQNQQINDLKNTVQKGYQNEEYLLKNSEAEKEKLLKELKNCEVHSSMLLSEFEREKKSGLLRTEKLQFELVQLEKQKWSDLDEIEKGKKEIGELKQQLNAQSELLEKEKGTLSGELQSLKSDLEGKIASLQKVIENLQGDRKILEEMQNELSSKLVKCNEAKISLKKSNAMANKSLQNSKEELKRLQEKLTNTTERVSSLTKELSVSVEEEIKARRLVDEMREEMEALELVQKVNFIPRRNYNPQSTLEERETLQTQILQLKTQEHALKLRVSNFEILIEDISKEFSSFINSLDVKAFGLFERKGKVNIKEIFSQLTSTIKVLQQTNNSQNITIQRQYIRVPPNMFHYILFGMVMITVHFLSKIYHQVDPGSFDAIISFMTWIPFVMFAALLKITLS